MPKDMNNLEDLLAQIGNANRFQVLMFVFVKLPTVLVAWTMLEMSFVKAEPDWCCVPKGVDDPEEYCYSGNGTFGDDCPNEANCTHRIFDDDMDTIVNEWSLLCDDDWKADLTISMQMAGVLLGNIITGYMADVLGRKKTFYISISGLTISSLLEGFTQSWETFLVMRFLLGLSCGIYLVVNIPYLMEFFSPAKRELPSIIPIGPLGGMVMTLTAWLLHDWRWVHWMCAALMFPLLSSWLFIPESLRWLAVKGKLDQAEDVVAYIARVNRRDVPKGCREVLEMVYEQEREMKESGKGTYSYLDIYRTWNLFKISVSLQAIWFIFSFCGYGIFFSASTQHMNLYLNMFLMGTAYAPLNLVMELFMAKVGRKAMAIILMTITALGGFAALAAYEIISDKSTREDTTSILCVITYSFLSSAWVIIMILNNETYPTVLRSLGYAASNTASRVGGILAPFAFDFDDRASLSYSMIGGLMTLCTILVFGLKETRGIDMTDTLLEADIKKEFNPSTKQNVSDNVDSLLVPDKRKQRNLYGGIGQSDRSKHPYTPDSDGKSKAFSNGGFSNDNQISETTSHDDTLNESFS